GNEQVLNTGEGNFVEPTFSPDGKHVVYRKIRGGYLISDKFGLENGIYRVAVSASAEPEQIAERGRLPQYGARNDRVYLMTPGEKPTLSAIDLRTLEQRELYQSE
ncbi:TolB family protein, partial [Idiomarina sp. UBA4206]